MKRALAATLLAACAGAPMLAQAEEPKSDWTFAGNFALSSEYLYRGIAQSDHKPAVSGGFDLGHSSGFYVGNWDSSISWISDAVQASGNAQGTSAPIEMDFYGGYKFEAFKGFTLDVGGLEYYYPIAGFKPSPSPNTFELYIAGSYGPATLKISNSTTELFGAPNSKNSYYVDLSATFDVGGGFSVVPHVGQQKVKGQTVDCDYTDYNVKVSKDLSGWSLGAGIFGTNAKDACYKPAAGPAAGDNLGASRLVVSVSKSF
jgi:uncharacterized protein (TIGR02001 family)